jgi:hypothetical protein
LHGSCVVRRLVFLLFFLALVEEGRSLYAKHMFAPFQWVDTLLIHPVANVRPIDVLFGGVLVLASLTVRAKSRMTRPVARTLFGALVVVILALAYGLATGGNARAAGWQVYLMLSMVMVTFMFASALRTAEDFVALGRVVVAAATCHALMCVIFHFAYVHSGLLSPTPDYEATHDDTVIWTSAIAFLLVQALQMPTRRNKLLAGMLVPLLLAAVQFNKRRLAWVSLAGCAITLYFLQPPSAAKRRINRVLAIAGPALLLYVAVGWERTEGIFRPLRSFQTVSSAEDSSTLARIAENLGLVATAKQGWLLGTGWGHGYVEITNKYQIYAFELWDYIPHNSVLGLLAYTGYVGFEGYWMVVPVAAFFHARMARLGARPVDRFVGTVALMQLVACADQWYGDMGSFSAVTMYTLSASLAVALRLPIVAGVWPERGSTP